MARETIQSIQPVAFHLIETGLDLPLVAMHFPNEWRAPLDHLAALSSERGSERPSSFRIQSLNAAITAFTPQLFVSPGQANRSDAPWLIATEEIRSDKILRIVRAWMAEHYSTRAELADAYDMAFEAIRHEDLMWEPFQLSPIQEPYPNNTARIDSLGYAALPAFVANALVKRDVRIPVGSQDRRLVRVPVAQDRAELQTWPPVYYEAENGRRAAYSYVIGISLQTLTGVPRPRIHLTYGVRRWRLDPLRTPDKLFLPGKEGRTVYLRHPRALTGVPQSSHFTRAMLDGVFVGENQRVPVWRDALAGIASRIGVALPVPDDLTLMPDRFLTPAQDDAVVAAIVEKTPRSHPVGAGMGLEVREAITSAITGALGDLIELVPPLIRSTVTGTPQRNQPMLEPDLREIPADVRLQALRDSIGPEVVVEIWYQNQACRDQLVESLHAILTGDRPALMADDEMGMPTPPIQVTQRNLFAGSEGSVPPPAPVKKPKRKRVAPDRPAVDVSSDHEILLPGSGVIRILPRQIGAWGAMLPEPTEADLKNRGEYKRRETQRRANQIAQELPATNGVPTLALIELPHFQDTRERQRRYQVGSRDPKRALRLGMAQAGRVTKFTQGSFHADQDQKNAGRSRMTPDELLRERCENAVLEGLRQMGYLPGAIKVTSIEGQSLPNRMVVAGVRMLRLTRKRTDTRIYLPVVTVFDTSRPGVYAWLPDEYINVRPFHEAMLAITRFKDRDVARFQQDAMLVRLEQFLTKTLPETFGSDVVILVEAQNMRWFWPGIQNGEIVQDGLRFRKGSTPMSLVNLEHRFRLIRLRTSDRSETPNWYTPGAKPGKDYASGLFRDSEAERTFYNIAVKPKTQGMARRGKQESPGEQYAIPSMLEILVAAQQPDDSDEAWALAVHTWRRMGYLAGGDMTLLPIPLQWAQKMDRYAAVIGPWVFRNQEYLWIDDNDIIEEEDTMSGAEQLLLFGEEDES
ncbi:hypothetical protein OSCT_1755 [Oscillochloris trichoides DG-6]|uniref:DUF3893 domain-containing protein n=1 Tax=Oscillochloris trichoides DG-6 TaxID=765420 RepID=E1IEK4_9CHLR|nr:DUF3962 domain-containing protein [Oscillochloris trichoides]EFO80396.1 hypothetical protein OSCT_1755 [Oscillochloris trichoides DG-6]